jgi:hypothetical protein
MNHFRKLVNSFFKNAEFFISFNAFILLFPPPRFVLLLSRLLLCSATGGEV